MGFDATSGTEGRVRTGAGSTPCAGISEWRINKQLTPVPVNHFELGADGDGNVWSAFEKGLANATVSIRGIYNVDVTDKTEGGTPALRLGTTVSLDLLFSRTPFGYLDVPGIITQFEAGTNIENQLGTFSMTVQVTAAVGAAA